MLRAQALRVLPANREAFLKGKMRKSLLTTAARFAYNARHGSSVYRFEISSNKSYKGVCNEVKGALWEHYITGVQ